MPLDKPPAREPVLTPQPSDNNALPDFQTFERALRSEDAMASAPETHGIICGMLCATPVPEPAPWIEQVLGRQPGQARSVAIDQLLMNMYETVESQLDDEGFAFHLLLPDDDQALRPRLRALRDWCEGFLFGFGSLIGVEIDQLSDGRREFIFDLREFCRLETDDSALDDSAEGSLAELVEYLRVGALGARQDCLAAARN